ncbi:MAG: c-type cytochrome [Bacteroidia bacterium]|jgi:mono/diheme cytochrome c family protein|nr:c-type cytochrome [Bacteroidia bacterium]
MYTGLLHTHRLVVILFLLLYVVKLILLLIGRTEALKSVTGRFRIPEMVISALFLLTGIGLLTQTAQISTMLIIKIVLVLASIPVAVIGFRNYNKILATLSVLLIVAAYGLAEMDKTGVSAAPIATEVVTDPAAPEYLAVAHGKALYVRNCIVCHGEDGALGGSGAKNLQITQLTDEQIRTLLINGKNAMPAYGSIYTPDEITAVMAYVKTLKK